MKFFPVSVQTDSRPVKRWSLSCDETGRCGLTKREMALNMKARLSGDLTSRGRENKFNDSGGVESGHAPKRPSYQRVPQAVEENGRNRLKGSRSSARPAVTLSSFLE